MVLTTYLLRANQESDFNAMVRYLESNGYTWNEGEEKTFEEVRNSFDKRKVIILRGMYDGRTKKHAIQATCLSELNKMQALLSVDIVWRMKDVQSTIPIEYYR